jgi:hypothetical protein
MNPSDHPKPHGPWILAAWLLVILSGALTTSLLRAPRVLSSVMPIVLVSHVVGGALIAAIAMGHLAVARPPGRWWRLPLIAGTGVCGWLAHQTLAPLTTATHAALAAFATIALADLNVETSTSSDTNPPTWMSVLARIGFVLVFAQVAAGAALRHHLIGVAWHLVIGGLAAMTVLGAGAAAVQHQITPIAAKQAIAAIALQAFLGVAVLYMVLLGPPSAGTWIAVSVGHVVVGSVALFAVGRFKSALGRHDPTNQRRDAAPPA